MIFGMWVHQVQNGNENDTDGAVDFFLSSLCELWLF
jgi:hypothetical protein